MEDKFLDLLWELELILNCRSGDSLIEKYNYFVTHSDHGRDCTYAHKTKALFYNNQFKQVRSKLLELNHLLYKLDSKRGSEQ